MVDWSCLVQLNQPRGKCFWRYFIGSNTPDKLNEVKTSIWPRSGPIYFVLYVQIQIENKVFLVW